MDGPELEAAEKAVEQIETIGDEIPADPIEETLPKETDPTEDEARSQGWRPKEEWQGDPEDWVDSKEFVGRAPIFKANKRLKDEIRAFKKATESLEEHNRKLAEHAKNAEEKGRQEALKDLQEQKEEAVLDGDLERFQEVESQIQEHTKPVEPENQEPEIPKAVTEWEEKNPWFNQDEARASYMLSRQAEYRGQGLSLEAALEKSTEDVKREFSHKFENSKRDTPSPTSGRTDSGGKASFSINDLPAEYRPVYQSIARKTNMKLSEYVAQLKEIGAM